ncbi:Alpha/Beta hydrolase protein [Syncephalis fuscata]|nr:Alpha/Beta hydrolase protein [Syncephalis fuscata]
MDYKHYTLPTVYTPNEDAKTVLDLYLPIVDADTKQAPPLLVFVHGGAWRTHDESEYKTMAQKLIECIVGYRLSRKDQLDTRYPMHLYDIAHGIAWLERNEQQYAYDPQRLYLAGHSAGAQLISMLVMTQTAVNTHTDKIEQTKPHLNGLRGLICVDGIYDIPQFITRYPSCIDFVETAFGNNLQDWQQESPALIKHTTPLAKSARFLVVHSLEDELVDCGQAEHFYANLQSLGYSAELDMTPKGSHVLMLSDATYIDHCIQFIQTIEQNQAN